MAATTTSARMIARGAKEPHVISSGVALLLLVSCCRLALLCRCLPYRNCELSETSTRLMVGVAAPAWTGHLWVPGQSASGRCTTGIDFKDHTSPTAGLAKLLPLPRRGWTQTTMLLFPRAVTQAVPQQLPQRELAPRQMQQKLLQQRMTVQTRRMAPQHGAPPPWCLRDRAWSKPVTTFWASCAYNCLPRKLSQAVNRGAEWGPCVEGYSNRTGKQSARQLSDTWKGIFSPGGGTTSGGAHMSDAPGVRMTTRHRGGERTGRPRSLCSKQFQTLAYLHPFGPYLTRLRFRSPRRPLTRSTPLDYKDPGNNCCCARSAGQLSRMVAGQIAQQARQVFFTLSHKPLKPPNIQPTLPRVTAEPVPSPAPISDCSP